MTRATLYTSSTQLSGGPAIRLLCLTICTLLASQSTAFADERDGEVETTISEGLRIAKSHWNLIKDYEPSKEEVNTQATGSQMADERAYWLLVVCYVNDQYLKMIKELDGLPIEAQAAAADYFSGRFGKEGPEADLRWFLAGFLEFRVATHDPDARVWCSARELLVEFHTRKLLADEALRKRYVHLVAWSEMLTKPAGRYPMPLAVTFNEMRDGNGFRKPGGREPLQECAQEMNYWRDARRFIVLASATDRCDLLYGARPANLEDRFYAWWRWFKKNFQHLRPRDDGPFWTFEKESKKEEASNKDLSRRVFEWYEAMAPTPPKNPLPDWGKRRRVTPIREFLALY